MGQSNESVWGYLTCFQFTAYQVCHNALPSSQTQQSQLLVVLQCMHLLFA